MRNTVWISLLRRIPSEKHGKLMVVTTAGREINIQNIFRMEEDYMVIRGRLAGTMDAASLLFIPYDQVDHLGFREEIKEAEVQEMFSGPGYTPPREVPVEAAPLEEATLSPPPPPAASAPLPGEATPAQQPITSAAKTALLERLRRSRLGQEK